MPYYSDQELKALNLLYCGKNVKISKDARIYFPETLSIDDNARIDDFCVISGDVTIGKYVHIAPYCLVNGHDGGVVFEDFSGIAMHVSVISTSDNYLGKGLTNPTTPRQYHKDNAAKVVLRKHCIVGAYCLIMPGVDLAIGCSVGSHSCVDAKQTIPWKVYLGKPAKPVGNRMKRIILQQEAQLMQTTNNQ